MGIMVPFRHLWRTKLEGCIAVLIVTMAVAMHAAMSASVKGAIWLALPYSNAADLRHLGRAHQHGAVPVIDAEFAAWERSAGDIATFCAFKTQERTLQESGGPLRVLGAQLTRGCGRVLELHILAGAPIGSTPGMGRSAFVSRQWISQRPNPQVGSLGNTIRLDGAAYTVVGVFDGTFQLPGGLQPVVLTELDVSSNPPVGRPVLFLNNVTALLNGGVSDDLLRARLFSASSQLQLALPVAIKELQKDSYISVTPLRDQATKRFKRPLAALSWGVTAVWVIACLNFMCLQVTRTLRRSRDILIRLSLGARWAQLYRHAYGEALLLVCAGLILGLYTASHLVVVLGSLFQSLGSHSHAITIDATTAIVAAVSAACAALAATTGALVYMRYYSFIASAVSLIRPQVRGSHLPTFGVVVSIQAGLSLVLFACTIVLGIGYYRMRLQPLGFVPESVEVGRIAPSTTDLAPVTTEQFVHLLLSRLEVPEMTEFAAATTVPTFGPASIVNISGARGSREISLQAKHDSVSSNYFRVLDIAITRGRGFSRQDSSAAPKVVLVNTALARALSVNGQVEGKTIRMADETDDAEIVGVVADVAALDRNDYTEFQVYSPLQQQPSSELFILLRDRAHDSKVRHAAMAGVVRSVAPTVPLFDVVPLTYMVDQATERERVLVSSFGILAAVGCAIAMSGVFGLVWIATLQAMRDIAIRRALGAPRVTLAIGTMWRSLRIGIAGVAIGVPVSIVATRSVADLLTGLTSNSATTAVFASALLTIVMCCLAAVPSVLQAVRVPVQTLLRE